MEWAEAARQHPLYLNLGGAEFRHPMPGYEGYISVDRDAPAGEWAIRHDLTKPIPLPNGSVTRIHTEDFLEHIPIADIRTLLIECHRLLAPGGFMRIGVPDYNNPKDRGCLERGSDPRFPTHVTLTHYELMKDLVEGSPFPRHTFYHYWKGDTYVHERMHYSRGMIRRVPEHHPKCRRRGIGQHVKLGLRDAVYAISRGFRVSEVDWLTRQGHRLHVTSLTLDLFKD